MNTCKTKASIKFFFSQRSQTNCKAPPYKMQFHPQCHLSPLNRVTYLYITYLVRKQRQLINSARLRNWVIIISIIIIFRIIIIFIDYLQFYEADTIVICMYRFLKEIVLSNLPEILPLYDNNT